MTEQKSQSDKFKDAAQALECDDVPNASASAWQSS